MFPPSTPTVQDPHSSPARQRFLQRLAARTIKPAARDYYVRWAENWTKARGHQSAARTQAFFDALGRSSHLHDWQFRGERRRPAGCARHPTAHSSANAPPKIPPRPPRIACPPNSTECFRDPDFLTKSPLLPLLSWHALSCRFNDRVERAMGTSTHPRGNCPFLYRTLYKKGQLPRAVQ